MLGNESRIAEPLVSICLPNLNGRRFLEERIASIRQQTFQEYEVVVVDSFSDDGSYRMLQQYAASDNRVRLTQRPRGLYRCWNESVELARGAWIYFACSDDTMEPDCLAALIQAATAEAGLQVVVSEFAEMDSTGRKRSRPRERLWRTAFGRRNNAGVLNPVRELTAGLVTGTPVTSVSQMLIHRSVFSGVAAFPEEFGSCGDYWWQLRVLGTVRSYFLPRVLAYWRRHEAQATSDNVAHFRQAWARMALALIKMGHLPSSTRVEMAAGYCVGMSCYDWKVLPTSGRIVAFLVRRAFLRRVHPLLMGLFLLMVPDREHGRRAIGR